MPPALKQKSKLYSFLVFVDQIKELNELAKQRKKSVSHCVRVAITRLLEDAKNGEV